MARKNLGFFENDTYGVGVRGQTRPGQTSDFLKKIHMAWVSEVRLGQDFLKMIHMAWVSEARLGQEKPRTFLKMKHMAWVSEARLGQENPQTF